MSCGVGRKSWWAEKGQTFKAKDPLSLMAESPSSPSEPQHSGLDLSGFFSPAVSLHSYPISPATFESPVDRSLVCLLSACSSGQRSSSKNHQEMFFWFSKRREACKFYRTIQHPRETLPLLCRGSLSTSSASIHCISLISCWLSNALVENRTY